MSGRPYLQKTIVELQSIFDSNKGNPQELKKLAAELLYRKVPRAVALAKHVTDAIETIQNENLKPQISLTTPLQEQPSQMPLIEKLPIQCGNCGQKPLIKFTPGTTQYICEPCKSKLHNSHHSGELSDEFDKPVKASKALSDIPLALRDAYKLLEADESSSWEHIEFTRRRLIQKFHPDKVIALPPNLRELAEIEGKKINAAYNLLRTAKGL